MDLGRGRDIRGLRGRSRRTDDLGMLASASCQWFKLDRPRLRMVNVILLKPGFLFLDVLTVKDPPPLDVCEHPPAI